jgi:glycosyltransferase involved in cell wall biosynthesis
MKVVLVGHPFSPIGMGEQLVSLSAALSSCYFQHQIFDVFPSLQNVNESERDWIKPIVTQDINDADIRIFNINGDEVDEVICQLNKNGLDWNCAINIIMPAWELSNYPVEWQEKLSIFDEIWAISNFVKECMSKFFDGPVRHIGQSCERRKGAIYSRKYFGLSDSAYTILGFFDESSYFTRKNPDALVKVLNRLEEEIPDEDFQIVIKTKNFNKESSFSTKSHPKLKQISGNLSYDEITSLIAATDTFVSLHRSEGLGRGGAEAALLGKTSVITGYSGVADYLHHPLVYPVKYKLVECKNGDYPHCKGQSWAEPDIEHAVSILIDLIKGSCVKENDGKLGLENITNLGVGFKAISAITEIAETKA